MCEVKNIKNNVAKFMLRTRMHEKAIDYVRMKLTNTIFLISRRTFLWKLFSWKPNKKCIEIEITTRCSLACLNCDRSIRQAPSNEYMSLKQIRKFVDESVELNWRWKRIRLMGGEPTLHPKLFEIFKIVERLRKIDPRCKIEIWTNGYGSEVNKVLSKLPDWVRVLNSNKNSNVNKFSSYNIAPIDLRDYQNADFSKGCGITNKSGLGLTRYGYYSCGAGASVDRVFGFDVGRKELSSVNDSTLRNQLRILCRYCGHYKENFGKELISKEKMSASWEKAYEEYRRAKPRLSVY